MSLENRETIKQMRIQRRKEERVFLRNSQKLEKEYIDKQKSLQSGYKVLNVFPKEIKNSINGYDSLVNFLLGSIYLYKLSKQLGFQLEVDFSQCSFGKNIKCVNIEDRHLYTFAQTDDCIITEKRDRMKFNIIRNINKNDKIIVYETESWSNEYSFEKDELEFIQRYLQPTEIIRAKIESVLKDDSSFYIVHIESFTEMEYLINNATILRMLPVYIVCNSYELKSRCVQSLQENGVSILVTNDMTSDNDIGGSAFDVCMIARASRIFSTEKWYNGYTLFIKLCSIIYNIPFVRLHPHCYSGICRNTTIENDFLTIPCNMNNRVVLITTFFECKNETKYKEWIHCLEKNIHDESIEHVVLFLEGFSNIMNTEDLKKMFNITDIQKLRLVKISTRPTFYDLFEYANNNFKNKTIMISNSDIYFENLKIITNLDMNNVILSLSRYSYTLDGELSLPSATCSTYPAKKYKIHDYIKYSSANNVYYEKYNTDSLKKYDSCYTYANEHTADCWAFQTPIKIDERYKEIFIGTFVCDNKLTKLFVDKTKYEGYKFENPCLSIKAIHYDFSTSRNYIHNDTTYDGVDLYILFVEWSFISDNFIPLNRS